MQRREIRHVHYFDITLTLSNTATFVGGLSVCFPDDIENGILHMQQHVLSPSHVPVNVVGIIWNFPLRSHPTFPNWQDST